MNGNNYKQKGQFPRGVFFASACLVSCTKTQTPNKDDENKLIYIFGGQDMACFPTNVLYSFSPSTLTFEQIETNRTEIPVPRCGHAVAPFDDALYIFGGYEKTLLNDFYRFDIEHSNWEQISCKGAPCPQVGHHLFVFADQLLFIGKDSQDSQETSLFWFSFSTQTWTKLKNETSVGLPYLVYRCAFYDPPNLYFFGGKEDNKNGFSNALYCVTIKPE